MLEMTPYLFTCQLFKPQRLPTFFGITHTQYDHPIALSGPHSPPAFHGTVPWTHICISQSSVDLWHSTCCGHTCISPLVDFRIS